MKKAIFINLIIFTAFELFSQWENQQSNTKEWLRDVWFTGIDTGYAVGYNGTILKTTDGQTWLPLISGTNNNLMSVFFITDSIGFASGANGTILKTNNAGLTWLKQSSAITTTFHDVFFVDKENGFIAAEGGVCMKTKNGGSKWDPLFLTSGNGRVAVYFNNLNTGYLVGVGNSDAILKTDNSGQTWTNLHANTLEEFSSVYFTALDTGFVVSTGSSKSILKTMDGGNTWENRNLTNKGDLYAICFYSSKIGYAVGGFPNEGTILISNDYGENWIQQLSNTSDPLFGVYFVAEREGYAVGKNGTILKTKNGGFSNMEEFKENMALRIYPNPTSGKVKIENMEHYGMLKLEILDINSRKMGNYSLDTYHDEVDISILTDGVYLLCFANNSKRYYKKLIVRH